MSDIITPDEKPKKRGPGRPKGVPNRSKQQKAADTKKKALKSVTKAEARAAEIIETAERQAKQIIKDAKARAKKILEGAVEEGRDPVTGKLLPGHKLSTGVKQRMNIKTEIDKLLPADLIASEMVEAYYKIKEEGTPKEQFDAILKLKQDSFGTAPKESMNVNVDVDAEMEYLPSKVAGLLEDFNNNNNSKINPIQEGEIVDGEIS